MHTLPAERPLFEDRDLAACTGKAERRHSSGRAAADNNNHVRRPRIPRRTGVLTPDR